MRIEKVTKTSVSALNPNRPVEIGQGWQRTVSIEVVWVAAICILDLATTLQWVTQGQAREANPVMAHFLNQGVMPFIAAKLFTFVPALVAAEWYRPRNPRLIQKLLRWVIAIYLFIYVAGIAGHYGHALEFWGSVLQR